MAICWSGDINVDQYTNLQGISLLSSSSDKSAIKPQIDTTSLTLLSLVDVDRIPLYLIAGTRLKVVTSNEVAESYLKSTLLPAPTSFETSEHQPWWQGARPDSPLGILTSCGGSSPGTNAKTQPRITELLFYASREPSTVRTRPATPSLSHPCAFTCPDSSGSTFQIYALPLSSDLAHNGLEPTPPPSPGDGSGVPAKFLAPPLYAHVETEVINVPPIRKRKSVSDALDEATERRRKARRNGGEGVAAAAAATRSPAERPPSLKHRRTTSSSHSIPLQTRPLSRASSVTSAQPAGTREPSVPLPVRRSALSRIKSLSTAPDLADELSIESKNKELISRVVMAGMRLYGLTQSKSRKPRADSADADAIVDMDRERKQDEEYKLMYHQVYKGTCFAFRRQIDVLALAGQAVQETVDSLLAIFCTDPLAVDLHLESDNLTPGGRKAFGSVAASATKHNPFSNSPLVAQA